MRYYEYLSSSKVEMLYPQIDRSSRSAGGEIGFDFKLIKASRKFDGARSLSIHDKLSVVEDWIYAHEPVGTIDDPDVWIYGRTNLIATMLTLRDWPGELRKIQRHPGLTEAVHGSTGEAISGPVLFAPAQASSGADLLMGGSAHHMAGRRGYPDMELPTQVRWASARVELLNVLGQFATDLGLPAQTNGRQRASRGEWSAVTGIAQLMRAEPTSMPNWIRGLYLENKHAFDVSPPVRLGECEFLAKRLWTQTSEHGTPKTATLATPLFVSVID